MESLTSNLTGSLWGLPFPHQLIKLWTNSQAVAAKNRKANWVDVNDEDGLVSLNSNLNQTPRGYDYFDWWHLPWLKTTIGKQGSRQYEYFHLGCPSVRQCLWWFSMAEVYT
jgi:hypothetical protein